MPCRTGIGLDARALHRATASVPETGETVRKAFPHGAGEVAEWAKGMPQPARCACESGPHGLRPGEEARQGRRPMRGRRRLQDAQAPWRQGEDRQARRRLPGAHARRGRARTAATT